MKIESNPPPTSMVKTAKSEQVKPSKKATKEVVQAKAEVKSSEQMRDKMSHWFMRAGIFSFASTNAESDISKSVAKHQFVKAQRKMRNLERILNLAMEYSLEQGSKEDIDPDWFFSFIDMAEDINAPAMQELWGKIFAVEIGHPGTFSLKTLQTLKNLTHKDAKILKVAVGLGARKKSEHGMKILLGYKQKPSLLSLLRIPQIHQLNLASYGLAYPDLLSLMDLGLIYTSEIETSELATQSRSQYRIGQDTFHITPKRRGLSLQYYKFTTTGYELAKLVQSKTKNAYLEELKNMLADDFEVT